MKEKKDIVYPVRISGKTYEEIKATIEQWNKTVVAEELKFKSVHDFLRKAVVFYLLHIQNTLRRMKEGIASD